MKDYIKFYKYDVDYQAAKPNLPIPHAVYCWETNLTDISEPLWNEKQYLAFQAVEGDATLTLINTGAVEPQLEYSFNQVDWNDWTASGYNAIPIAENTKVYLRGINSQMGYSSTRYSSFGGTGRYDVSGSISSIIDGDNIYGNLNRTAQSYMFTRLFYQNKSIRNWNVEIPYNFYSLTIGMFDNCFNDSSIQSFTYRIPNYSLISNYAFRSAFNSCEELTEATFIIPPMSKITAQQAFYYLFAGCTSLNKLIIEHHPPYSTAILVYSTWLGTVPDVATNIFRIYREDEPAWPRNSSGIPSNWTIEYLD